MRRFLLAAMLGLMVGATGPADAGVIYTYSLNTKLCTPGEFEHVICSTLTGGFSVDSAHFNATSVTVIDSFMTDLSFTVSARSNPDQPPRPAVTFDPASGFFPWVLRSLPRALWHSVLASTRSPVPSAVASLF